LQTDGAQPQGAPATNMTPVYIAAGVVGVGLLGYLAYRMAKKG
jgi:hypothetical protein